MCRPFIYSFDSRKNVFWMTRFATDMMIAVSSAMPKLEISKELPIKLSVSISVMALMTNKKSPRLSTVTGSVSNECESISTTCGGIQYGENETCPQSGTEARKLNIILEIASKSHEENSVNDNP